MHYKVAERMSHLILGSVFLLSIDSRSYTGGMFRRECKGLQLKKCLFMVQLICS